MNATSRLFTCLLSSCFALFAAAAASNPPPTAKPTSGEARAAASEKLASDPGWPREITRDGMKLVYYQPQIDSWVNQRDLTARIDLSTQYK